MNERLLAIYRRLAPVAMAPLHERVRRSVITVLPRNATLNIDYDQPLGDAGLFGPDSMVWRIHADFPSMMTGGAPAPSSADVKSRPLIGVSPMTRLMTKNGKAGTSRSVKR